MSAVALFAARVAMGSSAQLITLKDLDGSGPDGGLVADASGNLYGTTSEGGTGDGTIFKIAAGTHAFSTLATFNGSNGYLPYSNMIIDSSGNLYGTTLQGGQYGNGTVFKLAAGATTPTVLFSFNNTDGDSPEGLVSDASGNLYGTTADGGGTTNDGTVFKIAAGTNTFSTLATFTGTANGRAINSGLIIDSAGNLYGTAEQGGANNDGTVFKIAATTHTLSVLINFNSSSGASPSAGLTEDASGNFYGTTGGSSNGFLYGSIFKITAGTNAFTTLATFNGTDGAYPEATLLRDTAGDLFGTAEYGSGSVFELPIGASTPITVIGFNGSNGANPKGTLDVDSAGDFYGVTEGVSATSDGTAFEITNTGYIPEPSGLSLLAIGGVALLRRRRIMCDFKNLGGSK